MKQLRVTLVVDGPSDRRLLRVVEWALARCWSGDALLTFADFGALGGWPGELHKRISQAMEYFPADVYCVHRDADGVDEGARVAEIQGAIGISIDPGALWVAMIPNRMQEAWFLIDEDAIRLGANNPRGRARLDLPKVNRIEQIRDPKAELRRLLRDACELSGRRLEAFDVRRAMHRVADAIKDFSKLDQVASYRSFEERLCTTVSEVARSWGLA